MSQPCIELRPYQVAAIDALRAAFLAGHKRALAIMPTGCGKTHVFVEISRRLAESGRGRTLILAHRSELLEQAAAKLRAVGIEPGIEQGPSRAGDRAVVLASVQTLNGGRLEAYEPGAFRLVIIDEAHHCAADSYGRILQHFREALVIGVTATPDRLDGIAMSSVFDVVAFQYDVRTAISEGWLVPIVAHRVATGVDLDSVKVVAGDLSISDLGRVYGARKVVRGVVGPLLNLAGNRPTILFAVSIDHALALATELNVRQPGIAVAVSSKDPRQHRTDAVARFRAGEIQVLVNCELFTEGFDVPEVSCVALARPTASRALFMQMVGRGMRPSAGKSDLLLLDFAGNSRRHRLIGAADVLAGNEDDEIVQLANRTNGNVIEALAKAASTINGRRERAAEIRRIHWWHELGAVIGLQSVPPKSDCLATSPQLELLEQLGITNLPPTMSKHEATVLIGALDARRKGGLATYKQVRLLARHGFDARLFTFDQARNAIGRLFDRWPSARRASR